MNPGTSAMPPMASHASVAPINTERSAIHGNAMTIVSASQQTPNASEKVNFRRTLK